MASRFYGTPLSLQGGCRLRGLKRSSAYVNPIKRNCTIFFDGNTVMRRKRETPCCTGRGRHRAAQKEREYQDNFQFQTWASSDTSYSWTMQKGNRNTLNGTSRSCLGYRKITKVHLTIQALLVCLSIILAPCSLVIRDKIHVFAVLPYLSLPHSD